MNDALAETRNETAFATSSGRPRRPSGTSCSIIFCTSIGSARCFMSQTPPSKMILPGETQLIRTPSLPSGRDRPLTIMFKAAFAAEYATESPQSLMGAD